MSGRAAPVGPPAPTRACGPTQGRRAMGSPNHRTAPWRPALAQAMDVDALRSHRPAGLPRSPSAAISIAGTLDKIANWSQEGGRNCISIALGLRIPREIADYQGKRDRRSTLSTERSTLVSAWTPSGLNTGSGTARIQRYCLAAQEACTSRRSIQ